MRDQVEGLDVTTGVLGSAVTGSYSVNGWATTISDKFKHDWVLFPRGPEGARGYTAFTSNFSCASTAKSPDLAVDLLVYLTSTEAGTWSALEQGTGQPNARKFGVGHYGDLSFEEGLQAVQDAMQEILNLPCA